MTDAQKILGTDTLRQAYPKLNDAIDNANEALSTANTASQTANDAKTQSESTQTQLDQVVNRATDSDAMSVQATVDESGHAYSTLKERLDTEHADVTSKLAERETDIKNIVHPQTEPTKKPILTFIDDDCRIETYNLWKPLALSKGIKISLAVPVNWVINGKVTAGPNVNATCMTESQLTEMYNDGHEMLSHGWDSTTITDILSDSVTLYKELHDSRQWLIDNGYITEQGYDNFVWPQGLTATTDLSLKVQAKSEARKYYKYGIDAFTTDHYLKQGVFDSYDMPRYTSDGVDIATLEAELDKCVADNGWMIVLSHAWHVNDLDGGDTTAWTNRYSQLIDYAVSKGVEIMTFSEALKLRGNALSIGEYTEPQKLYVNNDGSNNLQKLFFDATYQTTRTMDDPITAYPEDSETVLAVNGTDDTFLGLGGAMRVVNTRPNMSYAMYFPYNNDDVYKRRWDETNSVWTTWSKVNSRTKFSYYTMSAVQTISAVNQFTKIAYNTKTSLEDLTGFDTTTSTFTVPESGYYQITASVGSSAVTSAETRNTLAIFKNGVEQADLGQYTTPANNYFGIIGTNFLKLNAGDTIDIRIYNTVAISISNAGKATYLEIVKMP